MEDLVAGLIGFVLEVIGEVVLQLIFELAAEAVQGLIGSRRKRRPAVSAAGLVVGGAAAGFLSAWLLPHRLIVTRVIVPGASLVLGPLATGAVMHLLGKRLQRMERQVSSLATFWGGALFAFSMALVRWWLVGLKG